jgi:hypothetical protein
MGDSIVYGTTEDSWNVWEAGTVINSDSNPIPEQNVSTAGDIPDFNGGFS